jgi:toxin ParE1/3/4
MKRNYVISEKALHDLEEIWLYTFKNWSQKQADRYYNLLVDEIEYISNHFETGISRDYIKPGYRSSKVKSHLIFFRKNEDGIAVIIRVLHERMDIENRLK